MTIHRQQYMKSYNKFYFRTKSGLLRKIYHHIIRNAKQRQHSLPTFTYNELCEWTFNQKNFQELFKKWEESNYSKNHTPSIDRKNNNISYTFQNIQLVPWYRNANNAYTDTRNKKINNSGLLNGGHKKVFEFDTAGKKLNEFISVQDAARKYFYKHQSISACCRNEKSLYKNRLWCYAKDENEFLNSLEERILKVNKIKKQLPYKVLKTDLITNETIHIYFSLKEACVNENVSFRIMKRWIENKDEPKKGKKKQYNFIKETN